MQENVSFPQEETAGLGGNYCLCGGEMAGNGQLQGYQCYRSSAGHLEGFVVSQETI